MAHGTTTQRDLIERITEALRLDQRVRGLFLSGSLGSHSADVYSDTDLLAIVERELHEEFAAAWREVLGGIAQVVYWNRLPAPVPILNAITSEWLRCDMLIVDRRELKRASRDSLGVLIDREDFYGGLPEHRMPAPPDAARIGALINEFIRVLGLLPLGVGRGEYVLGVEGVALLRQHLVTLLLDTSPIGGGRLSLNRRVSQPDLAMLKALPIAVPERQSVIDATLACAREFFARGKRLAETFSLAWPADFEDATRRHLRKQLGVEI